MTGSLVVASAGLMIPTLIFLPAAFRSDWPFFAARIVYFTCVASHLALDLQLRLLGLLRRPRRLHRVAAADLLHRRGEARPDLPALPAGGRRAGLGARAWISPAMLQAGEEHRPGEGGEEGVHLELARVWSWGVTRDWYIIVQTSSFWPLDSVPMVLTNLS